MVIGAARLVRILGLAFVVTIAFYADIPFIGAVLSPLRAPRSASNEVRGNGLVELEARVATHEQQYDQN
jgi:hypothetical protein